MNPDSPQPQPKHGLIIESNADYHQAFAGGVLSVSKSHLDVIHAQSPMHYLQRYLAADRVVPEPTPEMRFGTAVHTAVLEPDLLHQEVVEGPAIDRRSSRGRQVLADFEADHLDQIVLTPDDYGHLLKIRDRVHSHPKIAPLLARGRAEQSFYATDAETGVVIKCRPDWLAEDGAFMLDLKTTQDASKMGFGRSAQKLRYYLQPPWYFDILRQLYGETPKDWAFVAVEKEPPYACGLYFMPEHEWQPCYDAARRDLLLIAECMNTGQWPDYAGMAPDGGEPLTMPWRGR